MKIKKIALMGLILAFMAPSAQAAGLIHQKSIDETTIKFKESYQRYSLNWGQTATSVATGITSGLMYATLLSKGNVFSAFIAMLVTDLFKGELLFEKQPALQPGCTMTKDEFYRHKTIQQKRWDVDTLLTCVTMLGALTANAATGNLVIPAGTILHQDLNKIAAVMMLLLGF